MTWHRSSTCRKRGGRAVDPLTRDIVDIRGVKSSNDPTMVSLGNYPQAFSHIGVIASGVNLARLLEKAGRTH